MTKYHPVWIRDVAERTIATWVEAFLGLLLAGWSTNTVNLSVIESAAVAAIPAALAVIKGALAARVPGTVSPASIAEA